MTDRDHLNQEIAKLAFQECNSWLTRDLIIDKGICPRRWVTRHLFECDGLYIPYPPTPDGWIPCTTSIYRLKPGDAVIHSFPEVFCGAFELLNGEDGQVFKKPLGKGVTVDGEPLKEKNGLAILPAELVTGTRFVKARRFWLDKTEKALARNVFKREVIIGSGKRVWVDAFDWMTFQLTTLSIALHMSSNTSAVVKFQADLTPMWDDEQEEDPLTTLKAKALEGFGVYLPDAHTIFFSYTDDAGDALVIRTKDDLLKAYRSVLRVGSPTERKDKRLDLEIKTTPI